MADKINKEISALLSFKIKPRQDGYSDQVCRVFMCKIMLVGAAITGLSWWSETIHCIIPKYGDKDPVMDEGFVSAACWINGMYIYEDIRYHRNSLGYYGIPNDISLDGVYPSGTKCSTIKDKTSTCKPMKKTFFLQYQYMTFFLMGLAVLFYAPYCLFKLVNTDLNSLKASLKAGESAEKIVSTYFNKVPYAYNRVGRVFGNIAVKILYVVVSVVAFLIMDGTMNGEYLSYGTNWLKWAALNNTVAYDYMGRREFPKPGDVLFPSYAFCEVYEAAQDVITKLTNKHRFVCEMSQHINYQYIFIIIWFATVMAIVATIIGLAFTLIDHMLSLVASGQVSGSGDVGKNFSLWEFRYLELIRRKKLEVYGDVIRILLEKRVSPRSDKNELKPREMNSYGPLSTEDTF